jgi:hypothetical protein
MTNYDYEILTAEKPEGVTLDQAAEAIAAQYPDHHVVVDDTGDEFVATLARKSKVSRTVVAADDDAADLLDDAPPPAFKKKVEEEGDEPDDAPEDDKEPKDEKDDKKKDSDDSEDSNDPMAEAKKIVDVLKKVLPQLEKLIGPGVDELGDLGDEVHTPLHGDEGLGPLPPHGGPGGPVGPVPGGSPADALGTEGPAGLGGPKPPLPPRRPPVPSGNAPRPGVGVPTFSKRRHKVVFRPVANDDGSELTMDQASAEIQQHPKYAAYDVVNIKKDDTHYVAHLKLREDG